MPSGAWKSAIVGLAGSQRNNNNEWNHKNNSLWVYHVLGSMPRSLHSVSLSVLTIILWVKYVLLCPWYSWGNWSIISQIYLWEMLSQFKSKFILYFYPTYLASIVYYLSSYYCEITIIKVLYYSVLPHHMLPVWSFSNNNIFLGDPIKKVLIYILKDTAMHIYIHSLHA